MEDHHKLWLKLKERRPRLRKAMDALEIEVMNQAETPSFISWTSPDATVTCTPNSTNESKPDNSGDKSEPPEIL